MIDKLVLAVPIHANCPVFWSKETMSRDGGWTTRTKIKKTDLADIRLITTPAAKFLRVESNLARVYQGHNVTPLNITQLREAASALQRHVESELDLSLQPITSWRVASAEYCHDWLVEGDPSLYVVEIHRHAIQRKGAQRFLFESAGCDGSTFVFGPKSGGGKVYDKERQVQALCREREEVAKGPSHISMLKMLARGRLRIEITAKRLHFMRWLEIKRPTLGDVLDDLGEDPHGFIAMEWRRLVGHWEPTPYNEAKTKLTAKYVSKPQTVLRLLGDWALISVVGWDEYSKASEVHATTLTRTRRALREAGVFPGSMAGLPELEIHRWRADW